MAGGELDETVRRADPDGWLATRFIADPALRAEVVVLHAFDAELARARRVTTSALTAEIRLTWWDEVLQEIDEGRPVRAHPLAGALADVVGRRGLSVAPLAAMIEARIEALAESPAHASAAERWADEVGGSLAVLVAQVLGAGDAAPAARPAGRLLGLSRLLSETAIDRAIIADLVAASLGEADRAARTLPPAAFPAVAAAALVRRRTLGRSDGELSRRLRLTWAIARGRLS